MKKITGNDKFVYELSCNQMCGKGHYSMLAVIIVETQAEHNAWLAKQQSYYVQNHPVEAPAGEAPMSETPIADSAKTITMNIN